MQQFLKRHETQYLRDWAGYRVHKPLVIRGARQVGKSTLVRAFARLSRMPLVEVNFERNPEFREAFAVRDSVRILSTLALLTGKEITPARTLLFLDEIQVAPDALVALRYFHEEMPQLHVVAAGSLMEFALADASFSMPVGRVEFLHLGPMEFEDFLEASGNSNLAAHLRTFSLSDVEDGVFPAAVHRKCLDLLRRYWVVGGLPEAISAYVEAAENAGGEFARVSRVQQSVVAAYRDDFNKYSHGRLMDRWDASSSMCRSAASIGPPNWPRR